MHLRYPVLGIILSLIHKNTQIESQFLGSKIPRAREKARYAYWQTKLQLAAITADWTKSWRLGPNAGSYRRIEWLSMPSGTGEEKLLLILKALWISLAVISWHYFLVCWVRVLKDTKCTGRFECVSAITLWLLEKTRGRLENNLRHCRLLASAYSAAMSIRILSIICCIIVTSTQNFQGIVEAILFYCGSYSEYTFHNHYYFDYQNSEIKTYEQQKWPFCSFWNIYPNEKFTIVYYTTNHDSPKT